MAKVANTSRADPFFCSSLVKSESTWLQREELRFEAQKNGRGGGGGLTWGITSFVHIMIEPSKEVWGWKYLHIFYAFGPTRIFASILL